MTKKKLKFLGLHLVRLMGVLQFRVLGLRFMFKSSRLNTF